MINEALGTPNILIDILNENKEKIKKILIHKEDFILSLSLLKPKLRCSLKIHFYFDGKYKYTGDINYEVCVKSKFKDCVIYAYIPHISDLNLVNRTLLHELTHLYELYQVRKLYDRTSWIKTTNLNQFEEISKSDDVLEYFRYIFYLALPHEIRARVSSLKILLPHSTTRNSQELIKILHNTREYQFYLDLKDFKYIGYFHRLLYYYNIDTLCNIFNLFNELQSIKHKIYSEDDLEKYLQKMEKYFHTVADDYYRKMMKILSNTSITEKHKKISSDTFDFIKFKDFLKKNNTDKDSYVGINYTDFF